MRTEIQELKKSILVHALFLGATVLLFGWWNPSLIPCAYGILLLGTSKSMAGRKGYRPWARRFAYTLLGGLALVALFNFTIDPLWCFNHDNRWNSEQVGFNERLLKTNMVTFRDFRYQGLLIGSSRVAVLNQNDFTGVNAFNYAAATMIPDEYEGYIRYARKRNGEGFSTILIGVDFFGSNANYKKSFEHPDHFIDSSNSLLYRYKMLLAYDTLRHSKNNLIAGGAAVRGTYDRCNIRTPKFRTREMRDSLVRDQFVWFTAVGYGKQYYYDDRFKEKFLKLKADNPNTRFVVFTTPVSKPLFCLMVRMNRLEDYERWLRDLVDVFGEVYNFMDLNSVTRDYMRTFSDCDHLYPATGTLLAHRVLGIPDQSLPPDFGKLVTRRNVEETIAAVRVQCADCR